MHPRTPDRAEAEDLDPVDEADPSADLHAASRLGQPPLEGLSIAGITRRRVAWALATLIGIWVVVVFARQVGEAAAATARAEQIARDNAVLAADVSALELELTLIRKQEYIVQQARAFHLGGPKERAFALAPDAPPLTEQSPGSAAVRLGARETRATPLDSWLDLLFGPGD